MVPSERTSKSPIGTLGDIRRERGLQSPRRVPSSKVDKQMGALPEQRWAEVGRDEQEGERRASKAAGRRRGKIFMTTFSLLPNLISS